MNEQELTEASVQEHRNEAHYAVHFANRALAGHDWSEAAYVAARAALDELMLVLSKGKWLLGAVLGNHAGFLDQTGSHEELAQASAIFRKVTRRGNEIRAFLESGGELPAFDKEGEIDYHGTETKFFDGVPIVPSICPIVMLVGSNYEMGRQYAEQVLDIYGPFIFAWHGKRQLDAENRAEIGRWVAEMEGTMPEVIEFARGWADGSTERGVPMDHDQVLAIWVGINPPNKNMRPSAFGSGAKANDDLTSIYLGGGSANNETTRPGEKPSMCSGACAWDGGTRDGNLVIGATLDHDCTFQATVLAFPEKGNAFVYTPFSPNGWIPVLGHVFMAGHPGMNNKGVAYVHHAGANTGEPFEQWGYGVRRGASTFHLLQFADSAKAARDAIMSYPVGDTGVILGTVGGLWADASYGVAIEVRAGAPSPANPVIREVTFDRMGNAYNFLYANNNAISPASGHCNSSPSPEEGVSYRFELEAGWFTADPAVMQSGSRGQIARRTMSKDSAARNRYLHRTLLAGYGKIDADYMTMIYRQSGEIPEGDYDEVVKRYNEGEEWNVSIAHRANAFTAIALPEDGDKGIYRGCIGPANRAVHGRMPGHGYYYHDETAAFWEITLAEDPSSVVDIAQDLAAKLIGVAGAAIERIMGTDFAGMSSLEPFLEDARSALAEGRALMRAAAEQGGQTRLGTMSKALRRFTRAQVRANQVKEAIDPPATRPEMLELAQAAE